MSGIPARVEEAFSKLYANDTENAMVQASIAIDATAKKRFGSKSSNRFRFTSLLSAERDFLVYASLYFKSHLYIDGDLRFEGLGEFTDLLYKHVRCSLLHEGEASNIIFSKMEEQSTFGFRNGKLIISPCLIIGLLFLVIGDDVNKNLTFKRQWMMKVNNFEFDLNQYWGKIAVLKRGVGFEDRPVDFFERMRADKSTV